MLFLLIHLSFSQNITCLDGQINAFIVRISKVSYRMEYVEYAQDSKALIESLVIATNALKMSALTQSQDDYFHLNLGIILKMKLPMNARAKTRMVLIAMEYAKNV